MPALYPMMVAPEDFCVGDCVRKFMSQESVTPYIGVVTHVIPSTYKVWVQWPVENTQESPETLIKVNPAIFGMPTVRVDRGYDSYEKSISEKLHGHIPKQAAEQDKMVLRIAHTFATTVVGKLVDDIVSHMETGLSEVQTYNRIYGKYSSMCSDYIMQSSIKKVFANVKTPDRVASFKGGKYLVVRMEGQNPVEFSFSNTNEGISSIVEKAKDTGKSLRPGYSGSFVISEVLNILKDQKSWEDFLAKGVSKPWSNMLLVTTITENGSRVNHVAKYDGSSVDRLIEDVKQTHGDKQVTVISGFIGENSPKKGGQ